MRTSPRLPLRCGTASRSRGRLLRRRRLLLRRRRLCRRLLRRTIRSSDGLGDQWRHLLQTCQRQLSIEIHLVPPAPLSEDALIVSKMEANQRVLGPRSLPRGDSIRHAQLQIGERDLEPPGLDLIRIQDGVISSLLALVHPLGGEPEIGPLIRKLRIVVPTLEMIDRANRLVHRGISAAVPEPLRELWLELRPVVARSLGAGVITQPRMARRPAAVVERRRHRNPSDGDHRAALRDRARARLVDGVVPGTCSVSTSHRGQNGS